MICRENVLLGARCARPQPPFHPATCVRITGWKPVLDEINRPANPLVAVTA